MRVDGANFWDVLVIGAYLAYIVTLVAGTAYLVQVHSWSPWWFVLTLMLCSGNVKTGNAKVE